MGCRGTGEGRAWREGGDEKEWEGEGSEIDGVPFATETEGYLLEGFLLGVVLGGRGGGGHVCDGEGVVARVIAKRVVLDAQWYLVAIDVSLVSRCIWILGCDTATTGRSL